MAQGEPNHGQHVAKKKVNKLWSVCMFILVVEACERLCYYTIFNSMVNYLTDAGCDLAVKSPCHSNSTAFALRSSFRMLAYVMPFFGGYLADNVFGRYKTILYFTTAYVVGVTMMAIGALPAIVEQSTGYIVYLVGAFAFTALGTGAIKPNVVNFGADQYDTSDPEELEQQKSFFSYFYMVINIGSIFSAIWTVSIATDGVSSTGIGDGFFTALMIAAVCMTLSLMMFVLGTPRYSAESKAGVTPSGMIGCIYQHIAEGGRNGRLSLFALALLPLYLVVTLVGSLVGSNQPSILQIGSAEGITLMSIIAFVMCVVSSVILIGVHKNNDWIRPLANQGSLSAEEVQSALRVIPTIMCINIGFNVAYNGMDIYGAAACQMDVRVPDIDWLRDILLLKGGQFNGNFYSLGNNASIILAIPLLEACIFPMLKRMRGGIPVPRKAKYIAGFLLVVLANCSGILIEHVRASRPLLRCPADKIGSADCGTYDLGEPGVQYLFSHCSAGGQIPMSDINGWWTFIPYFITGCGEVLVNPIVQEFAFDEVAPRLRSLMMGFTLVAMGCVPSVITAVFSGFVPDDMNDGPVIWCYVINSAVSLILLGAYFLIAIPDKVHGPEDLLGSLASEGSTHTLSRVA